MPATNKVLHDPRYSADGVFCEPPRKIRDAAEVEDGAEGASQSRWNTGDYHWEERDVLEFARDAVKAKLLDDGASSIWSDKNGGALDVVDVALTGDAASNVRKGRRILTYSLTLVVTCEGQRNGAALKATLTTPEFCHDDEARAVAVSLKTEPLPTAAGTEMARAMKTHEMFSRVLKKKAQPAVEAAAVWLRDHLLEHKGTAPGDAS